MFLFSDSFYLTVEKCLCCQLTRLRKQKWRHVERFPNKLENKFIHGRRRGWLVIPGNPPTMQPNILSANNNMVCVHSCMWFMCDLGIKTWWTSVGKEPLAFSTSGPGTSLFGENSKDFRQSRHKSCERSRAMILAVGTHYKVSRWTCTHKHKMQTHEKYQQ